MILVIRTDKAESEIGLYDDVDKIEYFVWSAGRELSSSIHSQIINLLSRNKLKLSDLTGIVVYRGPGSFTGLRIGITVANTLAQALTIPIVGTLGDNWTEEGIEKLVNGLNENVVLPEYGAEPNITPPK